MTKDELRAENERLGAEIAALRDLLAAIAGARPPKPASIRDYPRCHEASHERLAWAAVAAREAADWSGQPGVGPEIVHAQARGLRSFLAEPVRYAVKADAAPPGMQDPAPVVRVTGVPVSGGIVVTGFCPAARGIPGQGGDLCELPLGHDGDHRAPGDDEGDPDITWGDKPQAVTA